MMEFMIVNATVPPPSCVDNSFIGQSFFSKMEEKTLFFVFFICVCILYLLFSFIQSFLLMKLANTFIKVINQLEVNLLPAAGDQLLISIKKL